MTRYWIGVVCEEHAKNGRKEGIAQFCHGKLWPVKKISKGDWIIYYSPRIKMNESKPCKSFTTIGQVVDADPYQVEQFPGFKPYRRKVEYQDAKTVPIDLLKDKLEFIKESPNWGMLMRRGFFEINGNDFKLISRAMRES